MNQKYLIIFVLLFISISNVIGTPDPSVNIEEQLLGSIVNNYVILECIYENFGYHGEWEETYSLVYRNKKTNLEAKRLFLKRQKVERFDINTPDKITIIEQANENRYLDLFSLENYWESMHNLSVKKIESNVIEFFGKYRDSEGGYTVEIKIPYNDIDTSCCAVINIFEDDNYIYFKIEYGCWPSHSKYFSISKTDFDELATHPK